MKLLFLLLASILGSAVASAGELVMIVSTETGMPYTSFRQGLLSDGLIKSFGDALAQQLQLTPRYLLAPRKRIESALRNGEGDLLCNMRPEWLDGKDWLWSTTILSSQEIIATRRDTAAIRSVHELRRQRIGTLLGYRYPNLEQPLGDEFKRDDAASDDQNLAKLLRNRFTYMLTNSVYYDYQRKLHRERAALNPVTYAVASTDTYCALPAHGKISLGALDQAILSLKRHGQLQAIQDRYRPARLVPGDTH
jgi:polar amino acid transport system substrate-binding protein